MVIGVKSLVPNLTPTSTNYFCYVLKEILKWLVWLEWLERKRFRYTSPLLQNEVLEVLALGIMREITANIQTAGIYTIMADETADISNTEQLAICFRWIDKNMEAHQDFVGLHPLSRTTADSIVQVLKDVLLRMNLDVKDSRGQCYNGAATMSDKASGVATQFKLEN